MASISSAEGIFGLWLIELDQRMVVDRWPADFWSLEMDGAAKFLKNRWRYTGLTSWFGLGWKPML